MIVIVLKWLVNNIIMNICIVGGGLANLYDRFLYGSVTDFLFMDFNITRTGIFNTADLSVTTGLILILLSSFKDWRKNSTNSN